MKQALHIFKKDVRYLRFEIAITLVAVVVFIPAVLHQVSALAAFLPLTWWFLIARVIHAEALPGHRQFWLTRPYAWKSLLAAKLLFALAFVCLPLLIADIVVLQMAGFSTSQQIPGLIWMQVLLLAAFVLPAAALAAVTSGIAEFWFISLLLALIGLPLFVAGNWIHWILPWFEVEWVRTYCLLADIAVAAGVVLLWQYARRNTLGTRLVIGAAVGLLLAITLVLPWTAAFAVQTALSPSHVPMGTIHVDLDYGKKWLAHIYPSNSEQVVAELPIKISAVPDGLQLKLNGVEIELSAPDGERQYNHARPQTAFDAEAAITSVRLVMDKSFYTRVRSEPLKLHGKIFITLNGNRRAARIPLTGDPVPASNVGLCSAGVHFVRCSSVFRNTPDLVSVRIFQSSGVGSQAITEEPFPLASYSPFPAGLNVNPLAQSSFSPIVGSISEAYVESLAPIAHREVEFEMNDVRLSEFGANHNGGNETAPLPSK